MASRGTTAQDVRYYREGADVKNYIRPYYRTGAALGLRGYGTKAPEERYYRDPSGTTAGACGTTAP